MRIIIEIPDVDENSTAPERITWAVTRATLEAVEHGASRHCLARTERGWAHHRLGVTVERA